MVRERGQVREQSRHAAAGGQCNREKERGRTREQQRAAARGEMDCERQREIRLDRGAERGRDGPWRCGFEREERERDRRRGDQCGLSESEVADHRTRDGGEQ